MLNDNGSAILTLSGGQLALTVIVLILSSLVVKLVQHRLAWRALKLPGPPHSLLWGYALVLDGYRQRIRKTMAPDAHHEYFALELVKDYGTMVYLDTWPFSRSLCIVTDPVIVDKIVRQDALPKAYSEMEGVKPILGTRSIVMADFSTEGSAHWSSLRTALRPALAKGQIERAWTDDVVQAVQRLVSRWSTAAAKGRSINSFEDFKVSPARHNDACVECPY